MDFWIGLACFAGGFVASIFAWPKVREFFNGAETEIAALEDKARALRDKIKAQL